MSTLPALVLVAAVTLPAAGQEGATDSAVEFAARLQRKYDTVRDFSADFVQTYEGGALRRKTTEGGSVLVKKPGKMRWTYTSPEDKLFVSDGKKMYSWVPADKQVVVRDVPTGDEASTPLLFLVGKGDLSRDFVASYTRIPNAPPASVALRLTPRRRESDYDWLVLVVDRETLKLQMLVAVDSQGGASTFRFSNLQENFGMPDSKFAFSIPRGADVVTQ